VSGCCSPAEGGGGGRGKGPHFKGSREIGVITSPGFYGRLSAEMADREAVKRVPCFSDFACVPV